MLHSVHPFEDNFIYTEHNHKIQKEVNRMFSDEELIQYEEHLHVAIELLNQSNPNNEVIETLEEINHKIGEEIENRNIPSDI